MRAITLVLIPVALLCVAGASAQEPPEIDACLRSKGCPDPASQYCDKPVRQCRELGTCMPRPQEAQCLNDPYEPVCGCDGSSYPNDCFAKLNGVSVARPGKCPLPTDTTECESNEDCESGFCSRAPTTVEAALDRCSGAGVCAPRPQVCTFQFDPVCGCDGKTYGNACWARKNGVDVASAGECKPAKKSKSG